MPATLEEIKTMRNRLISTHGADLVELASMMRFFWNSTEQQGQLRRLNFKPLTQCLHARLRELQINPHDLETVLEDLERCDEVLSMLAALPD